MGGQINLSFDINVAAKPQPDAGKVTALAVTSKKRTPSLSKVPTLAERGYPDHEIGALAGHGGAAWPARRRLQGPGQGAG